MEEVSFIRERLTFLALTRRKLRKELNIQYSHIFSVMYRINRSSSEDILSQNKVYINTVLLEEALELYTNIYENLYNVSGKGINSY